MRIDEEWEAQEVTVVRLFRRGQPIVDTDGRPIDYSSIEDATYVARNWHVYGMPPGGLRDLSDEDLRARMRRVAAVDSERTG